MQATDYIPTHRAPVGGSSNFQFFLTDEQHSDLLAFTNQAGSGTAGWKRLFRDLVGGTVAYDRDAEPMYNEAGELVDDRVTRDERVITNSVMGTDDVTILTLEWLESNPVKARYFLPMLSDGRFKKDGDGDTHGQIRGYDKVRARRTNRSTPNGREDQRAMEYELVALNPGDGRRTEYIYDGNLTDQDEWPAALATFKDYSE